MNKGKDEKGHYLNYKNIKIYYDPSMLNEYKESRQLLERIAKDQHKDKKRKLRELYNRNN